MKILILVLLTMGFSVSHAASKREILDLLHQAEYALLDTQIDASQLDEAAESLRAALAILGQEPGMGNNNQTACLEYAISKYREAGNGSATSMDKAAAACAVVKDAGVMKFAFEKYREAGNGSSTSMDKAINVAAGIKNERMGCVQIAFKNYREAGNGSSTSMDKAAAACQ
jgi:plasmid stabilization system protein ParE